VAEYLTAVATQPGSLRWEWSEVVPFHEAPDAVGFAAFGDVVVSGGDAERRAPIRATLFAVATPDGWRLRQFHGSIASDF
jgi:SnoaL-like domain